jgi:hypothetical protein
MSALRLTEDDRQRLGVDGDLPIDLAGITNREAIALKTVGFATPNLFRAALREEDPAAITALVWLCLKRAGVQADLASLEFDIDDLDYIPDPDPSPAWEPGKAPPGPEDSTSSESLSLTASAT